MAEKRLESIRKEIEKLTTRRDHAAAVMEKKFAAAEKVGAGWTTAEWIEHRDTASAKLSGAWFDYSVAASEFENIDHRLTAAKKRLLKSESEVRIAVEQRDREEAEKAMAEEIARWKEVGITVDEKSSNLIMFGTTPSGKYWSLYGNNGFTARSFVCGALWIDGKMIFTSGTICRAFNYLRKA